LSYDKLILRCPVAGHLFVFHTAGCCVLPDSPRIIRV